MIRKFLIISAVLPTVISFLTVGCSSIERKMLFYPTHRPADNGLAPWISNGNIIGYSRNVETPVNIWLMLHGNGGQASDRTYAIPCFSPEDSVFILEYPGYGKREGVPSKETFNQAAKDAYLFLRSTFPKIPICAVGESIGSGPASFLACLNPPPDKLVLIVPFEKLSLVAKDHVSSVLVALMMTDNWDNLESLSNYKGPVEIFGAIADTVIPVGHAKALAAGIPSSKFILIQGGHNDWSRQERVKIRNP